ncbi:MAG: hypothetical protein HC802_19680 [Caldilineaceae bacterium]|nr:hypothetical protein [Caldilineaceae bacterium]
MALDSDGRLWVGTYEGGIFIRELDGAWTQHLNDPDDPMSLPDNRIIGSGIAVDPRTDGGMWVIFDNEGLAHWDGESWDVGEYSLNLPSNLLWTAFTDPETGDLWVGSEGGVTRFDGLTWGVFGAKDGLLSPVTYAIAKDADGGYWLGGRSGLSHYLPEGTPPWIKVVGINDQRQVNGPMSASVYANENVLIDFDAGDLQTPRDKLKILYRQTDGTSTSAWREISPGYLQLVFTEAGDYVLEFLVRDQSFNYSRVEAQPLVVLPPPPTVMIPLLGESNKISFRRWSFSACLRLAAPAMSVWR